MRLLIVTQYFWPENFRINDLVTELVLRGHRVTVLTGLPNYPDGAIFEEYRENPSCYLLHGGAEIIRVPILARGQSGIRLMLNYLSFVISASFFGLWRLRRHQFDVIFTYQLSPVTVGLPAAFIRAIKKAPMAMWVLDLWPDTLQAVGALRSPFLLKLVGKLVSFIYKRCDVILAQSRSFIPEIKKYTGDGKRVKYFPSWAESVFDIHDVTPAKEVPVKPGSFNIMFAGNIGDAQDFPAILAAAEKLKSRTNIRWLIVGDGRMADWVRDEIGRRDLQECVLMLGRHSLDRMPSFFKHAQALLVSLKDEPIFSMTIPGKLQSYLAAGIPVVAMLNGEGAEILRRSGAGLSCPAGDHAALAASVLTLSAMGEEERELIGRNGRDISNLEFQRDMLLDRLEKWIEQLKSDGVSVSET